MIDSHFVSIVPDLLQLMKNTQKIILDIYKDFDGKSEQKEDTTPLTVADLASNEILSYELPKIFKAPVISEENKIQPKVKEYYWLIDPLDGTKNFIKKNHEFSINISLMKNNRPILGIIHMPYFDESFWSVLGQGAFSIDSSGTGERIFTRAINSNKIRIAHSHFNHKIQTRFQNNPHKHRIDLYPLGSAYKFCKIASGVCDVYLSLGGTGIWDTAAAQLILEEAGGAVVDFSGNPLQYNSNELKNKDFIAIGDKGFDLQNFLKSFDF